MQLPFAEICELVVSGKSLRDACAAFGIKQWRFQEIVLADPLLRSMWMAAKDRGKNGRLAAGHLRHADEILTLMASGRSLRDICALDPRFPHRQAFARALDWDPVRRARYDAAIRKWSAPHARSLIHFDEIERRIIAGGAIVDVLASGDTFPESRSWYMFLKAHPDYDARYRAAFRAREAGPNARGIVPKYSDRELQRAAADLLMSDKRYASIGHVVPEGPHTRTIMEARARSPELRAAVEHAIVVRRARLGLSGPRFNPAAATASMAPDQTCRLKVWSSNEIWRLAAAALPKTLDRDTRDDVIADIAMEVLEGKLSPHLIGKRAGEFLRAHNKKFSTFTTRSLDAPLTSDSTMTLLDTLTTSDW